jgi:serine protease inhibitor
MKSLFFSVLLLGLLAGCERDDFGSRDSGGSVGLPVPEDDPGDDRTENNAEAPSLNNQTGDWNNANSPDPGLPTQEPDLGHSSLEFAQALEAVTRATFTDTLSQPGNVVFSPVGLVNSLVVVGQGGDVQTRDAVTSRLASSAFGEISAGLSAYAEAHAGGVLWFPTLWIATDAQPSDMFLEGVFPTLLDDVRMVDFSSPEATRQVINNYYRTQTDGVIASAIGPLGLVAGQTAALVDAVYFKGTWVQGFDASLTSEGIFYSDTGAVSIAFMQQIQSFEVHRGEDFDAIELPYHDGFSLAVVVPDSAEAMTRLQTEFSVQFLSEIEHLSSPELVNLRMPRVEVEGRLEADLFGVSVSEAVSRQEGMALAGLEGGTALVQRTVVSFDETGTTGVVSNDSPEAAVGDVPGFDIDRPFLFAVRNDSTGTVLLAGRVVNP